LQVFTDLVKDSVKQDKREDKELANHGKEIQFLASMSKETLHEFVMALQNLITISIISSGVM
jgi:hypothetical protein